MDQNQLREKCTALGLSEAGSNSTLRSQIYAKLKELVSGNGTNGVVGGTAMMAEEQEQVEPVQAEQEQGEDQGTKRKAISLYEFLDKHGLIYSFDEELGIFPEKPPKTSLAALAVKHGIPSVFLKAKETPADETLNAVDVTLKGLCCKYGFTAQLQTKKRKSATSSSSSSSSAATEIRRSKRLCNNRRTYYNDEEGSDEDEGSAEDDNSAGDGCWH